MRGMAAGETITPGHGFDVITHKKMKTLTALLGNDCIAFRFRIAFW